jgi:hypothetical protein
MVRRALVAVMVFFFVIGFSAVALRYIAPSLFHSAKSKAPSPQQAEDSRIGLLQVNEDQAFRPRTADRPVYPYSVVAGGVEDARELKWVAEHDPVVAAHYAGFDYDHARVVRLVLARTAYVSYRIGNHVYWTRHRIKLRKGEKVITDGRMTARARCANRIEEVPSQATSSSEPPVAKFEEPVHPGEGTAVQNPPQPFQSALLNRPAMPGMGPMPPLSVFNPFEGSNWTPIVPPPLPTGGVCSPGKKKGQVEIAVGANGKKKVVPCNGPPAVIPEPGTWLLVASGLAAMLWQGRRKLARS